MKENEKAIAELKALLELMVWFDEKKIRMPSWKLRRFWEFLGSTESTEGRLDCAQPFCMDEPKEHL